MMSEKEYKESKIVLYIYIYILLYIKCSSCFLYSAFYCLLVLLTLVDVSESGYNHISYETCNTRKNK